MADTQWRIPNPNSPEEVRRAFSKARQSASDIATDLSAAESDIDALEAEAILLDGRLDDLEAVSPAYYSGEADEDVSAGLPLYVVSGTAHVALARHDTDSKSGAVGLAKADTATGFSCEYQTDGKFTLGDWTAVIGAASLSSGSLYFLGETGGLTTVAPITAGYNVTEIGTAVSTTTLDLQVRRPILL